MSTAKYFSKCPAFPSGLPVAKLPTVSLEELADRRDEVASRLFEALRNEGFFLLDLRSAEGTLGATLLQSAEQMFQLAAEVSKMGSPSLYPFAVNGETKRFEGYKPPRVMKVDDNKLDTVEWYSMLQDELLGNTARTNHPTPIEDHWEACKAFCQRSRAVAEVILNALDTKLGLEAGTLAALTDPSKTSDTYLRWLWNQPVTRQLAEADAEHSVTTSFGKHNDIGIITILFNVAGGLQILPAGKEDEESNWEYIRPEPGFALVNLGDTLVEWTGGVLRSSVHRVVESPGDQGSITRFSCVYLDKAYRGASMRRLRGDGSVIPEAKEGDEEEICSVETYFERRMLAIRNGDWKPRSWGGAPVSAT